MCVHIITHSIQLNSFSAVAVFSAHVLGEISTSFESSLPKNPEQISPIGGSRKSLENRFFFNGVDPPEFSCICKGIFLQSTLHEDSTFQDRDLQSRIG